MLRRPGWLLTLLAVILIAGPLTPLGASSARETSLARDSQAESASIVEHQLDFFSFTYETTEGYTLNLRDYVQGKRLVIVEYLAGWCPNSNRNGHIIQRLWTKYRERGLGVVGVAEYSSVDELKIHIGRIGVDYPIAIETRARDQRKGSLHYKYRRAAGDNRKWGTPFYVIIEAQDVAPATAGGPLARRVFTVSGEIVEDEAEEFIKRSLAKFESK